METPIEYFYGETLRWSFGFDNPNKAAVLFACVIPVLCWLWQVSWRIGNRWLRIPALLVSAILLAGAWYCLIMTYSRGGLVAALAAMAYLAGREMWLRRRSVARWHRQARAWITLFLATGLLAAAVWNGLGSRSAEALGNDASVGNRIELWGSALQMAAENPGGFGSGKSGEQYMQWYQPLARQQGYRTMVNSYLTFLVERGWLWSSAILVMFTVFWAWTVPAEHAPLQYSLRASILGFLTAAIFSTTMEEGKLWIVPGIAAAILLATTIRNRRPLQRKNLIPAGAFALATCAILWSAGTLKSRRDPLKREFVEIGGFHGVGAIAPENPRPRSLGCMVDESVMGDQYPKLLREMALRAEVRILLGGRAGQAERILCAGGSALHHRSFARKPLILLAPEILMEKDISSLAARAEPAEILIPEIDEDGRVGFWEETTGGPLKANFRTTALTGVGNRVDWAWSEVIELVKGG